MSIKSKVLRATKYAAVTGVIAGAGYMVYKQFGTDTAKEMTTDALDAAGVDASSVVETVSETVSAFFSK